MAWSGMISFRVMWTCGLLFLMSYAFAGDCQRQLDLYTLSTEDPLIHQFRYCQEQYKIAHPDIKNPLLDAPKNLAAGDSQMTIAQKKENSRLQALSDMALKQLQQTDMAYSVMGSAKGITNSGQAMAAKVSAVTDHSLNTDTFMCSFKNSMKYDINNNTATMQSICETYNAKLTYSTFSNAYEFNVFKQLPSDSKIGVKTTNFSNSGLVFIEGKW